jgi:deoxyribodipyrimidine photo-lyase
VAATILWFRQDLRLTDNPAWNRAVERGVPVIPLYLLSEGEAHIDDSDMDWSPGGAGRWWLHHALEDLDNQLSPLGLKLVLRRGRTAGLIKELVAETGADAVYWNRCYEPWRMRIDSALKTELQAGGIEAWSGNSALLIEPWRVSTQAGKPYKVFTPFSRAHAAHPRPEPETVNGVPLPPERWPMSLPLEELNLLPRTHWAGGLKATWDATRAGAEKQLNDFLDTGISGYSHGRDIPSKPGTSRMSPYLHWGQMGPRELADRINVVPEGRGRQSWYRELVWREFAYHVLYHFSATPEMPLQPKFAAFPWDSSKENLRAWQEGRTGYPIVDAGMRELWTTGWMHNRVRMIVASFLVKHLRQNWLEGARWFWDTLVDADLASNTLGWQWAGGCGADAAPYFRIFNPMTQSEKFDKQGHYIRTYVPELKAVPDRYLAAPWEMPESVQRAVGCVIGEDYPAPIIEHKPAREAALAALASLKESD